MKSQTRTHEDRTYEKGRERLVIERRIEKMAKALRSELSDVYSTVCPEKPAVPVRQIAERLGIQYIEQPWPKDKTRGVLYREEATDNVVIGVNSSQCRVDQRFMVARLLGHFLLHPAKQQHFEVSRFSLKRYRIDAPQSEKEQIEATWFASMLLLPNDLLHDVVMLHWQGQIDYCREDQQQLQQLAHLFLVHPVVVGARLAKIGYV